MSTLLILAAIVGGLGGKFVSKTVSESIAHQFISLHEGGFYSVPIIPIDGASETGLGDSYPEEAYLERLCTVPPKY
tara:strand:+ start:718 stop:945 length:228 start_codon:yes stop_codon:yes gene_type:complete